jgi:DNA-binding NarL/FixJ family response regulator
MTPNTEHALAADPDRWEGLRPIRLLVVGEPAAVGGRLRGESDFLVLAAGTAQAALSVAERQPVDVAVVVHRLLGRSGLWLSRKLKRLPNPPRVLIYSAHRDGLLIAAAVVAEADGVINECAGPELCDAVKGVASGRSLLPALPQPVGEALRSMLDGEEQAIFGISLAGIPRPEIARILGIPQSRLEFRLAEMVRKIESVEAVVSAGSLPVLRPPLG